MVHPQRHILIVTDEDDSRSSLYSLFDYEGCLVGTRRDPQEAYSYVARHHPDIVLGDLRMNPAAQGTFVSEIKRIWPASRVVLLDSVPDEALRRRALLSGADDLVDRHAMGEEILGHVRRFMDGD